jgi:hypothetical protein
LPLFGGTFVMRLPKIAPWQMMVALLAAVLIAWRLAGWVVNHPRDAFLHRVHVGDTELAVVNAVGEPDERLLKGSTLARWGGFPARVVPGDAWVYCIGVIDRMTVIFRDGKVEVIMSERITDT